MGNLWLLMIVLACPLMMIFMMRGMGGGAKTDQDHAKGQVQPDAGAELRIAQLEREVAELRGVTLRKTVDNPARRQ